MEILFLNTYKVLHSCLILASSLVCLYSYSFGEMKIQEVKYTVRESFLRSFTSCREQGPSLPFGFGTLAWEGSSLKSPGMLHVSGKGTAGHSPP